MVRRLDPHGKALVGCRKTFRLCSIPCRSESDESLQTGKEGHAFAWTNVEQNSEAGRRWCARQGSWRMVYERRLRDMFVNGCFFRKK